MKNNIIPHSLYRVLQGTSILLLVAIGVVIAPQEVKAVNENFTNVPQWIRDEMYTPRGPSQPYDGYGQTYGGGGSNNQCGRVNPLYNHAQFTWLSRNGNNSEQTFTVAPNTNTVNLWFNNLSAHCDSLINSSGTITNQTLKKTRTQVGGVAVSHGLSINWPSANKAIQLDYATSYFYNDRYVHGSTPGMPANQPFSLSGIQNNNNLQPREEPYTITIFAYIRAIHEYNNGTTYYRCVANAQPATSLTDANCPSEGKELKFKLYVREALDAECLTSGAGTNVPDQMLAGQTYQVSVVVGNTGSQPWLNGEFGITDQLGSGADNYAGTPNVDPRTTRDNTHWQASQPPPSPTGPIRLKLPNYQVPPNQGLASVRIVTFQVTAPSAPGVHPFWWQMVNERRDGSGNLIGGEWYGSPCKKNIQVITPENRPYLTVAGGDVISGASFAPVTSCTATTDATKAHIKTNGYFSSTNGSSGSQYAVLASGVIGNDNNYPAANTFLGNYGYLRSDGGDQRKDALFANLNLINDEYGDFYRGSEQPGLPCVNIQTIQQSSTERISPAAAQGFISNPQSGTRTIDDNVTIPIKSVPANVRKTLIVNGTVTITGRITYPAQHGSAAAVPFLQIIADNIYIESGVDRIDANLVAYPRSAGTGIIDTCSTVGVRGTWPGSLVVESCPTPLTVNGSMIARRILWKRTSGTLGPAAGTVANSCVASTSSNTDNSVASLRQCAAEQIMYGGEAYLGRFNEGTQTVDSVPRDTLELPPIY